MGAVAPTHWLVSMAAASAQPRDNLAPVPAPGPARWRAEQTAHIQADREAWAEASVRLTPVTDAEIEKHGTGHQDSEPEPERERLDADLAEIRASAEAAEAGVDPLPEREAGHVAEIDEAGVNEPVIHEPQAEPSLEPSWQPGDAGGHSWPTSRRPVLRWTLRKQRPTLRPSWRCNSGPDSCAFAQMAGRHPAEGANSAVLWNESATGPRCP